MSQTLIEKLKKARLKEVNVDKYTFIISRPTELDMALSNSRLGINVRDVLAKYVVGWKNITELDIVPGGMPEEVPFSSELFMEWVEDKKEFWNPIALAIKNSYSDYQQQLETQAKN